MISLPADFMTPEAFAAYVKSLVEANSSCALEKDGGSGSTTVAHDPHLELSWFALLAQTAMPKGVKLALLSCGGAWLPMMYQPDAGGRLEGLSNFYTPLFGLANGTAVDEAALDQHLKALRKISGLSELRFAPMDSGGESFQVLSSCLRRAGWWVGDYFCFGNWYHAVTEGSWSDYLAKRPGRVRTTLARAERRLAKAGFHIEIVKDAGEPLEQAIQAFVAVYGTSWKTPEPYPEFIPGLCRMAAGKRYLRLGVLRMNEKPIAAQLWLVANATAYIVKLAYDPQFAHFSPGSVLTAAMFRHALDKDRVSCIDYLIGDDSYKTDWMSSRRERRGVIAFNPGSFPGLIGALRHFVGARLRASSR